MNTTAPSKIDFVSLARETGIGSLDVPRPQTRWHTRIALPLLIFLIAGGLLAYAAREALIPTIEVNVVPVVAKSVPVEAGPDQSQTNAAEGPAVLAPGWIEPDPYITNVPALVDGVVREVLVLEGESVAEGQVVARLVDDDIRLEERTAAAVVNERQAELHHAIANIEPRRSAVSIAQFEAEMIRDDLQRKKELVSAGSVSAGEFARLEFQLRAAEARIEQAKGELAAAQAEKVKAQAALETARALHAQTQLRLSRTEVRSLTSGIVLARLIAPGTRIVVNSNDASSMEMTATLLRLYDPARLQVRADVPLADAARIGVGTPAEITTEALSGQTFTGRVSRIVHEANIQRNTVQFKIAIDQPSPHLKPEMLCRVRFNPGSAERAAPANDAHSGLQLYLPSSALIERQGDNARVWVAQATASPQTSTARLRDVTLGEEVDGEILIRSGVNPGDRIIVEPPVKLRTAMRVRVRGDAPVSDSNSNHESH